MRVRDAFPTKPSDLLAMVVAYALTGLLAYMVTHQAQTARFLMGVFS